MLQRPGKRKARDFSCCKEPCEKKTITDELINDMKCLRIAPVKWNPTLYTLNRFDVPVSHLKRQRKLKEESEKDVTEDLQELIRPMKKLCVNKDRKEFPQNRRKNCTICNDNNNNDINNENNNEDYKDENINENNSNHNPKKISLIEFLYKDKEPDITTLNSSTSEGSEKLFKLREWLGAQLKEANNTIRNSSKALVLYKSPYELLKQALYKYLLLFPTKFKSFPLQIQESNQPHIKNIDDDDIECGVEIEEVEEDEEEGMGEGHKIVGEENFVMEKETERLEMDAGILLKKGFMHKNNSWLELQKGA